MNPIKPSAMLAATVLLLALCSQPLRGNDPNPAPEKPATGQIPARLHYRPGTDKAGDAIPFYHDGTYHVFFLKGPDWAHIASRDLLRWQELPTALVRGTDPQGPDGEAVWTGSIVERDGTFHLFYTGKNINDPLGDQKVMMARSSDLVNWTKLPGSTFYADGHTYWSKPVNGAIDDKQIYHHQAFRDPHVVWDSQQGRWWLGLHAVLADGSKPCVALYTSDDLDTWTPAEPLIVYPASVSGDCPDLFRIGDRWNVNLADYHYMQVDGQGAQDPEVLPYDCGDLRVAKTMHDGKRRILIGWIGDYKGATDDGQYEWGGTLSMPRELYADSRGRLFQRPPAEIVRSFSKPVIRRKRVALDETIEVPANSMLCATLDGRGSRPVATLRFRQPAGQPDGGYALTVDFDSRAISLGDGRRLFSHTCDFDPEKPVNIRLFMDGTVAECFVNDAYCFTMRIYDHAAGAVSFSSTDPTLRVGQFSVSVQPGKDK